VPSITPFTPFGAFSSQGSTDDTAVPFEQLQPLWQPTAGTAAAALEHYTNPNHQPNNSTIFTCCEDKGAVQNANDGQLLAFVVTAYLLSQLCYFVLDLIRCKKHPLDICSGK
jgi:hypothetical protein